MEHKTGEKIVMVNRDRHIKFIQHFPNVVRADVKSNYNHNFLSWEWFNNESEEWVNMNYKIGDKVVMINKELNEEAPEFFPPVGTIGVVSGASYNDLSLEVTWPDATVELRESSLSYTWWIDKDSVRLYEEKERG